MPRFALLLFLSIALPLVACGKKEAEPDLQFISPVEIHDMDPQKMTWLQDVRIANCLFQPLLVRKLPEMTLEPGAAESYDVSPDNLTYTFHLRKDGKWSNGDPVTANDFIYAWRRGMLPDFAADYSQMFFCIAGAEDFFKWRGDQLKVYADPARTRNPDEERDCWKQAQDQFAKTVGLSAPDDRTLVVKLARPTPYFLELVAFVTFMPNHAKSLDAALTINHDTGMLTLDPNWTDAGKLISNGPYRLERHRFKRDLLMLQNKHFWDKAAMKNKSILQLTISNPQTALLKFDQGEADWLPELPTASPIARDVVEQGRKDAHLIPWAGTYFYSFNCEPLLKNGDKNPLADMRVRQALSLAIDRTTLVEKVTMKQPIALSFIPPQALPDYNPPVKDGVGYDLKEAKKLLRAAGYAVEDGDKGDRLEGLSILYNSEGGHEAVAQAIKRNWEEQLGVSVKLEVLESTSFRERLKTQDYTIARASWIGDYPDPTTFLDKYRSDNGNNDSQWKNKKYDAIMDKAANELDHAKRMDLLEEAEAILLREQPIAPIYHYVTLHMYDDARVKNLNPNMWNFTRLEEVEVVRKAN